MQDIAEVNLPSNWQELSLPQRFATLRPSPDLVRGQILAKTRIDCRMGNIADLNSGYSIHFNYPGREGGSFTFMVPHGRSVRGDLEILSADAQPYERIFVLSGTSSRMDAEKGPGGLTRQELAQVASLLETFRNHCSPGQLGRHFDVCVVLAKQRA